MGTYTTNYNLFMPTVGETGWGTLVNGNFTTIDSTMKSLSNRITAVENEVNGNLSCTSVTTSGKITGNGGIAGTTGTFSGAVTGTSFNGAIITSTKFNGVVLKSSGTITVTPNTTEMGFVPTYGDHDRNTGVGTITLLPVLPNVKYSGSITFKNMASSDCNVYWQNGKDEDYFAKYYIPPNSTYTLTFTSIPYLVVSAHARYSIKYCGFTLS